MGGLRGKRMGGVTESFRSRRLKPLSETLTVSLKHCVGFLTSALPTMHKQFLGCASATPVEVAADPNLGMQPCRPLSIAWSGKRPCGGAKKISNRDSKVIN